MSWFYSNAIYVPSDSDVLTYQANVISAGGTNSATELEALDAFAIGCKADSIWTSLVDVGPLCGSSLTAALVKLVRYEPSASWNYTNNNFVSGDYSQATGLTGNGSTKYLNAGGINSFITVGNTGIATYDRTTANGTISIHGSQTNANPNQGFALISANTDNKPYAIQYDDANTLAGSVISGAIGFVHGVRSSGPLSRIYRNGVSVASTGTVGGSLPGSNFFWFARNLSGTPQLYSTHNHSFLAVTTGMDATQAANLYTRVQALQTALGRNV